MTAVENKWKAGRKVRITFLHPDDGLSSHRKDIIGEEFITGDRPFRFYTNPYSTYRGIIAEALNRKLEDVANGSLLLVFSKDTKFKYIDMEEKPKFRIPDLNFIWATLLLALSVATGAFSTILETDDGDTGFLGTAWNAVMAGDMLAGASLLFTVVLFGWFFLTISRWFR